MSHPSDNGAHSDSDILVSLLGALEDAPERASETLEGFCEAHPEDATRLREFVATQRLLAAGSDPPPSPAPVPDRLGDFRIVRELMRGGMGVIYEAVQEPLERRVVVKTIREDVRRYSPRASSRFQGEQEILAGLHHTHIVPIHAAGREGDLHYYAMAYIEGSSLSALIESLSSSDPEPPSVSTPALAKLAKPESEKARRTDRREQTSLARPIKLSMAYFRSVAGVMADAADAVDSAHEAGILHRDIKPSNLMVDGVGHCWVIDFGLAGYLNDEGRGHGRKAWSQGAVESAPTRAVGTYQYMAPEQYRTRPGDRVDRRSDVYGLGATLYELLTLTRAFDGPTEDRIRERVLAEEPRPPGKLVKGLPPDLERVCLKALNKMPGDRYPTAKEFAGDLRLWLDREPTSVWRTPQRRLLLWSRRNKLLASFMVAALLASVAATVAILDSHDSRRRVAEAAAERSHSEVLAAEGRERETRREARMQQLQRLQLSEHDAGWSVDGWDLTRQIQKIKTTDDLRERAAALLRGVDARTSKKFDFQPTDLAFDPSGTQLLMTRYLEAPRGGDSPRRVQEVRICNPETDERRNLPQSTHDEYGPVTFRGGTPLQPAWDRGDGGVISIWDLSEGKAIRRLAVPENVQGRPAAFSMPASGSIVGALIERGDDRHIVIWEYESGKVLRATATRATDLELSPDGSLVAASDLNGMIEVWSLAGGEKIASLSSGQAAIACMAWTRDYLHRAADKEKGWLLAAGAAGGDLTIWDVQAKIPRSFCRGSAEDVHRLAFSPDGMTLASVGRYRPILWDVATGHIILRLGYRNTMVSLAFSPDGKRLAIGSVTAFGSQGGIDVWELEASRGQHVLRGLLAPVSQVRYSSDGRFLAALAQNWQLAIWDLEKSRLLHVFDTPKGRFAQSAALAFDREGNRFAFASGDGAKMWDVSTGAVVGSWDLPLGFLDKMAFQGPDRLLLIRQESVVAGSVPFGANDPEKTPRVCRVRNLLGPEPRKPLIEIKDFPLNALAILATPDGNQSVVEGVKVKGKKYAREIKLFDVSTGQERWSLPSEFTADGHRVVSIDPSGKFLSLLDGSPGSMTILVDLNSARQVRAFENPPADFSSGVKLWVSKWTDHENGSLGKLSIVRGDDEARILTLEGGDRLSSSSTPFSPDDRQIAIGNADGSVTVCDIQQIQRRLAEVGLGW